MDLDDIIWNNAYCFRKSGKQGKPVQVLLFELVGKHPKPFEFFKLHFEEATPLAKIE